MIEGGRLFCIPYDMTRGPAEKNTILLNHMVDHPMWFSGPLSKEEVRVNSAWMMTDPSFFKYEIWNGGRMAGMLVLSRVVAPVDALFHFTFFGTQASGVSLFGAKTLIKNFLAYAFEEFGLRRISMEIPEHYPTLIKFARQKLGFRYEAEGNDVRFKRLRPKAEFEDPSARAALALHGSRKEGAHYNPKTGEWGDVILLRLFRQDLPASRSSVTTLETSSTEVSECRLDQSPPNTPNQSPEISAA